MSTAIEVLVNFIIVSPTFGMIPAAANINNVGHTFSSHKNSGEP